MFAGRASWNHQYFISASHFIQWEGPSESNGCYFTSVVMVIFFYLTGLWDARELIYKYYFSKASKLFLEEIHILISRLSKEDWAHYCGLASSNQLRAWVEWRDGGRSNLLFTWTGTSYSSSCPETLALLVLGLSDSDWDLELQILYLWYSVSHIGFP